MLSSDSGCAKKDVRAVAPEGMPPPTGPGAGSAAPAPRLSAARSVRPTGMRTSRLRLLFVLLLWLRRFLLGLRWWLRLSRLLWLWWSRFLYLYLRLLLRDLDHKLRAAEFR